MSCIVSTTPLFAGSCVVSEYPGFGIRGDQIPAAGSDGPSPVFNDLSLPADAAKEYRWEFVSITAGWAAQLFENLTATITPPGGTVSATGVFTYRLFEDGADIGVATETVFIGTTGQMAATEAGADSVAIAGTVAWPALTGSVAAAESGSDTASIVGASALPPIAGSLSAVEAGQDVVAVVGDSALAPITGTVSASEVGIDALAASGFVTLPPITGNFGAIESGQDTASFTWVTVIATTLHEDIQALLSSLAPAGGVWFQQNTDQPPTFPFITWMRVVSVANVNLEGPSDLQNTQVQVDVFAINAQQAYTLAKQVEARMFDGTITCGASTSQDLYEEAIRAYRVSQDFGLWARN